MESTATVVVLVLRILVLSIVLVLTRDSYSYSLVLVLVLVQSYKVQQFRCYRSGLRHLLGEYGGIEADRQTNSSRQQAAADS